MSMEHLRIAEAAVSRARALLPEARVFPDMMKMSDAPYVCIHAESLALLLVLVSPLQAA